MNPVLYDKNMTCPVCNLPFHTKKVRTSAVRVKKRDADYCTYYEGENPLFYEVFVCPHCGYAALEKVFDDITPSQKQLFLSKISKQWVQRDLGKERTVQDAIEVYKLALLCSEVLHQKKDRLGLICLRLAWWYRFLEDEEKEKIFLQHAVNCFEEVFRFGTRTNGNLVDDIMLLYLLGELNRRLGKYEEAISWFNRTISQPGIQMRKIIEEQAREQWRLAKEAYRQIKESGGEEK